MHQEVSHRVRVEIRGRDQFWANAFHVEWKHQFPDRQFITEGDNYLVEPEWLNDLERIAAQTFCRIVQAPDNPRRRRWFRGLLHRHDAE